MDQFNFIFLCRKKRTARIQSDLGTYNIRTSTGLYRSCAALACLSGTFDLISFEAVNFEIMVEKVWFGLERRLGQTDKIKDFWFTLLEFV